MTVYTMGRRPRLIVAEAASHAALAWHACEAQVINTARSEVVGVMRMVECVFVCVGGGVTLLLVCRVLLWLILFVNNNAHVTDCDSGMCSTYNVCHQPTPAPTPLPTPLQTLSPMLRVGDFRCGIVMVMLAVPTS